MTSNTWTHPDSLTLSGLPPGYVVTGKAFINSRGKGLAGFQMEVASYSDSIFSSDNFFGSWNIPTNSEDSHFLTTNITSNIQTYIDSDGNALVAWSGYDNYSNYQVFHSDYRKGKWYNPVDRFDAAGRGNNVFAFLGNTGFMIWENFNIDGSTIVPVISYAEYPPL